MRLNNLTVQRAVLDQYLASPLAKQAEEAKRLLREIKTCDIDVSEAARRGQEPGGRAAHGLSPRGRGALVAAIDTPELRPIYERTLLQAFRQENNRRQMIPKRVIAQNPNPAEADQIDKDQQAAPEPAAAEPEGIPNPKLSVLGPDPSRPESSGGESRSPKQ